MKFETDTRVADILESHEKRIRYLELTLQGILLFSVLRGAVLLGGNAIKKFNGLHQ